jgi:hypothetical protein
VRLEVAQVEAVDVPIRHVHGADPLGRLRLGGLLVLVVGVGRRLELTFAEVPLDADAVEQPEGGAGEEPAQHQQVALDRLQKEAAGVVGAEVVQVGDNRDVEAGLHDESRGDRLFQGALGRVPALGLRQHDGQTVTAHRNFSPR